MAIIGIDLGTSTSEAVVFKNGKTVMIPNPEGEFITPSVVGLDENGRFLIGKSAEEQYLLYPERTVIEVKRKMGSGEKIKLDQTEYSPKEISAEILSYLKHYAEEYLQTEVDRAVITVPAYFTNQQRNETIEAGELAGLSVERIINEPTAAALCYGIEHMEEESHLLVYDFGGGTFDVTLLEMFDGVLDVKASSGDNQLGGKDFDERIIEYLIRQCRSKYSVDLKNDIYAMVKLKEEAVKCKIALSNRESYEVLIPMISEHEGKPVSLQETITKKDFEAMIAELVERTRKPVTVVLNDGGCSMSEVDTILLVGGSTRVPYVRKFVAELFGREPVSLVDPDLAVALGAGVQCGMIEGEIDRETGIMLTDVAPYALGVRIAEDKGFYVDDNCLDILIPRNITIPASRKKRYQTCVDYQEETWIEVYQGEEERATDNVLLGKFLLSGIPPRPAHEEAVEVEFSYDMNGILHVKAVVVSTGAQASITIEMRDVVKEVVDTSKWKEAPGAKKFRSSVRKAERLLETDLEAEDRKELEELLENLKRGLVRSVDFGELQELEWELLDFIDLI